MDINALADAITGLVADNTSDAIRIVRIPQHSDGTTIGLLLYKHQAKVCSLFISTKYMIVEYQKTDVTRSKRISLADPNAFDNILETIKYDCV